MNEIKHNIFLLIVGFFFLISLSLMLYFLNALETLHKKMINLEQRMDRIELKVEKLSDDLHMLTIDDEELPIITVR
jgi:hypothetical protein